MKTHFFTSLLSVALLIFNLPAPAADIDLYTNSTGSNGQSSSDLPNVLFIIDNTANWNTAFNNEMSALANTLNGLPVNADGSAKFNVGFMFSAETGNPNNNVSGGYVRAAIRPMSSTNIGLYKTLVQSFDKLADKGNGGASGITMAEVYYYFKGLAPYAGNGKAKTDYTGNNCSECNNLTASAKAANNAVYALPGNALASKDATIYQAPAAGNCSKYYIIYISNGPNQENNAADTLANTKLTAAGGDATQINLTPSGSQGNPSDEWARFMKNSSLGVTTFTIDVDPVTTGQGPGWSKLLRSMADVSGGTYTAVTSGSGGANIAAAINDALSKIQSVNSVFAAVSLPASATVQGAYLNQIYIGMFRPDADTKPRWMGNLKQYKLDTTQLNLRDADNQPAIDSGTGFITACARSFWTPGNADNYWANKPQGECLVGDAATTKASNKPDGNIVEKGAQAYVLRSGSPTTRTVKTCSATFSSCTSLTDFNNSNVTAANLGAANNTERDLLIDWAKGKNVDGELGKTTTEMRPSAHGDVIHSNPLAISYGSDVVVFYGGNDGMFRAVNGNQTADKNGVAPGAEFWSFMPPEFYGSIKRLRDNSTLISFAGSTDPNDKPKPYSIDGPIAAYKPSDDKTWLYAAMRRGGRALYAFNVTDPANPSLLWKKGCPDLTTHTGCSATGDLNLNDLGQTWSLPQTVRAPGYESGAKPLIIMGGGYDDCEDSDPNTCSSGGHVKMGNKIYVLDAETGALLKVFDTDRSVVGDVKIVPDTNGLAKFAYAADLGGNIYRISGVDANTGFLNTAPTNWHITKIASLGCSTTASCTDNRKFMFGPSVVPETDGSYSLYLGSGDREKPINNTSTGFYAHAAAVTNYFFKVKDNPAVASWLSSEKDSGRCDAELICINSLTQVRSAGSCNATLGTATEKGWIFGLRTTEQVVTTAATRFGVTTFSTHMPAVPTPGSCKPNLGTTRVYNLNLTDATPVAGTTCDDHVQGDGLPPPPEKPDVCMNADCTIKTPVCIGCGKNSAIEAGSNPSSSYSQSQIGKRRVYWYIER